MPSVQQIMNMSDEEIADSTWEFETIENFRVNAKNKMDGVKETVKTLLSDIVEVQKFANAIDPEESGLSRILKFPTYFEMYYRKPLELEFANLKSRFYQYYKSFILQYPTLVVQEKGCFKEVDREDLPLQGYQSRYRNAFWFKIYIELRMAEAGIQLNVKERNKHLKRMIEISKLHESLGDGLDLAQKKLDFLNAIDYIESQTMNKFVAEAKIYNSLEIQMRINAVALWLQKYKIVI